MEVVIRKIFFDQVSLISQTDDKLVYSIMRINLHQVPYDRTSTDLNKGLRANLCLFGKPRTESAGENHERVNYRLLQRKSPFEPARFDMTHPWVAWCKERKHVFFERAANRLDRDRRARYRCRVILSCRPAEINALRRGRR